MSTVLDDVTDETVDAAYVQRRVDDWAARVEGLYAELRGWLPDGWSARAGAPVRMHEEMMRRFDVAPREIPTLRLAGAADECAVLEPRGLWIVGEGRSLSRRPAVGVRSLGLGASRSITVRLGHPLGGV